MGRVFKTSLCIIMIVGILCLSLSVYAADGEGEEIVLPTVQEAQVAYFIWEFLNAIGIEINITDTVGFTTGVRQQILEWVVEYIGDLIDLEEVPSTYTISTWIAPWQADFDYWGNLRYNNNMLEDLESFVDWLIPKYNLTDNSIHTVEAVYLLDNLPVYQVNHYYPCAMYTAGQINSYPNAQYVNSVQVNLSDYNLSNVYYFVWQNSDVGTETSGFLNYVFISEEPANASFRIFNGIYDFNLNELNREAPWVYLTQSNLYGELYSSTTSVFRFSNGSNYQYFIPADAEIFLGTREELNAFLLHAELDVNGLEIHTGEIELPSESPNYVSGDGMVIIDNHPNYQIIEWDNNVTVDNLPAVISENNIGNPQLGNLFSWIPTFVDMASDSMNFFKQVIYMMPDQVLVCIFAVMGAGVLFGILRLMREH